MHAYMIIAHRQFDLLAKLITALDDERNDIFVHIDAKVRDFDFEKFKALPKRSRIYFTPRIGVTWGDFSQVKCELILLAEVDKMQKSGRAYDYVHLISGADLPIKSNDEIHRFFNENAGRQFVHFTADNVSENSEGRIKYYHLFRRRRNLFTKILAQIALRVQMLCGVNRLKNKNIKVQKGCNWFSITGAFAAYIAQASKPLEKIFRFSYCGDEVFVQTALLNSPFAADAYMKNCGNNHLACARLIDWQRGNPYVFRTEDFEMIKNSPAVFARKFDMDVDSEIIDKVLQSIK
jgi:hypothetical protein